MTSKYKKYTQKCVFLFFQIHLFILSFYNKKKEKEGGGGGGGNQRMSHPKHNVHQDWREE